MFFFLCKDLIYLKSTRNDERVKYEWPEIISEKDVPNAWPEVFTNNDENDPVKTYRNTDDFIDRPIYINPSDDEKIPYETLLDDKNLNTDDKIKLIDLVDSQKDNNENLEILFEINDQKNVVTVPRYQHHKNDHNFERNIQKRDLDYDHANIFEDDEDSKSEDSIEDIW